MPQATFTVANFSLSSTWTVVRDPVPGMTTPTTASTTKNFTITGITAGSTINSAVLTATLGSPATGAAIRSVAIEGGSNQTFNGSLNVTSAVAASFGAGDNTISALFRFKANGTTDYPLGNRSSSLTFSDVKLTIDYTLPYATKVWNGSTWVSGTPYVWNGSTWVQGTAYVWNGSQWKPGLS